MAGGSTPGDPRLTNPDKNRRVRRGDDRQGWGHRLRGRSPRNTKKGTLPDTQVRSDDADADDA